MDFKRARSNEQIQSRMDEIVCAAAKIYDESGYENITFTSIAEITNFTRPTIYKYFSTKEEILLKLLSTDLDTWSKTLITSFKLNTIYTTKQISKIWAKSYSAQTRLLELCSILFTIIEKNVSLEALADFKASIFNSINPVYELISQLYPKADLARIYYFLTIQQSVVLGLYPMCNPSETQKEAIKLSKTNINVPDFEEAFEKALFQLMYFLEQNIE